MGVSREREGELGVSREREGEWVQYLDDVLSCFCCGVRTLTLRRRPFSFVGLAPSEESTQRKKERGREKERERERESEAEGGA